MAAEAQMRRIEKLSALHPVYAGFIKNNEVCRNAKKYVKFLSEKSVLKTREKSVLKELKIKIKEYMPTKGKSIESQKQFLHDNDDFGRMLTGVE